MKTIKSKARVILPDGEYFGFQTAYYVKVQFNDIIYKFEVDVGLRGFDIPCAITVVNSYAHITTK